MTFEEKKKASCKWVEVKIRKNLFWKQKVSKYLTACSAHHELMQNNIKVSCGKMCCYRHQRCRRIRVLIYNSFYVKFLMEREAVKMLQT